MEITTALGLVLDIGVIIAVVIPLIMGFRRGMKRQVLSIIALAVSGAVAYVVSGIFAPQIYESYLKEPTLSVCVRTAERFDPVSAARESLQKEGLELTDDRIREILSYADAEKVAELRETAEAYGYSAEDAKRLAEQYSDRLPKQVSEAVRQQVPQVAEAIEKGALTNEQIADSVRMIVNSPETAGEYAEEHYAAPLVTAGIRAAFFIGCFIVMQLVMLVVFMLFGFDLKKKADTPGDKAAGLFIGAVCAAADILLMCIAVGGIFGSGQVPFDIMSVDSSLFLPLYNILY